MSVSDVDPGTKIPLSEVPGAVVPVIFTTTFAAEATFEPCVAVQIAGKQHNDIRSNDISQLNDNWTLVTAKLNYQHVIL